jgi:phage terminase small subunit
MTEKQKKFCIEYLIDLNATQAAIRAGYSEDTAEIIGFENLRKPNIKEYIDEFLDDYLKRSKVSIAKVLNRLDEIIESDIGEFAEIKEKTTEKDGISITSQGVVLKDTAELNTRVLSEISETNSGIKIKMKDTLKAIDLKGKYLAMWTEKVEHSINDESYQKLKDLYGQK